MKSRVQFPLWAVVALVCLCAIVFGMGRRLTKLNASGTANAGSVVALVFALLLIAELISYLLFVNFYSDALFHIRAFRLMLMAIAVVLAISLVFSLAT